jgi:endonuclease-3 related protein
LIRPNTAKKSKYSDAVKPSLLTIYDGLLAEHGPQHWWPARTRAEMMIGAVLTQNTAWTNVEKAVSNLRKHSALHFQTLEKTSAEQIAEWIRPAGTFNQKAGYLQNLAALLSAAGSLDDLFKLPTPELRRQLLAVKGIGPETADCILLYAAKRPVFVVDAYTRRLLAHHGYQKESEASYARIADLFTAALPRDTQLYNEYHALIVHWGKVNR